MIKTVADPPFLYPGNNTEEWAKTLQEEDFELLCTDGSRKPVKQAIDCHLARAPNHAVVSREDKAACVRRILDRQQVWWHRQGLQPFLPGCVWIIWGFPS